MIRFLTRLVPFLQRGALLSCCILSLASGAAGQVNPHPYFEVAPFAFAPRVEYPAGTAPFSLTVLDWDRDGTLDLLASNRDSGDLILFLGREDGTFVRQTAPLPRGNCPVQMEGSDFHRDGKGDLVAVNHLCQTLSLAVRGRVGTLSNRATYQVAPEPRSVTVGFFNDDLNPDLAILHRQSGALSLYFDQGDGSFANPVDFPAGLPVNDVAAGDFDRDGRPDLAVVNTGTSTLTLFRNLGGGQFLRTSDQVVGSGSRTLQVVDLNRDGHLDLAVVDPSLDLVYILQGRGNFLFDTARSYPVGRRPFEIESADINADGIPDLVVAHQEESNLLILLGRGDGTFAPTTRLNWIQTGRAVYDVVAADFNRDGRVDLATANFVDNSISLLYSVASQFADLAITQAASRMTVVGGDELLLTLTVTNQGPDPATNLLVTNLLPAKTLMTFCQASGGGVCGLDGEARVVSIPTLAAAGQVEIQFRVRVLENVCQGETLRNTATITSQTGDPRLGDNQTTLQVLAQNPPPVISSLPNLQAIGSRPGDRTGARVEFLLPEATDNAPGVRVTCSHPSGTLFPVGRTEVTCQAVDICGETATTRFEVRVWDAIAIDQRYGHLFLFDSFTGQYLFVRLDTGESFSGQGVVRRLRCELQLLDGQRAIVTINTCFSRANGWVSPTGSAPFFTIDDPNLRDNRLP